MIANPSTHPDPGLCQSCQHARRIESEFANHFGDDAGAACRILYGGSVKPDNIKIQVARSSVSSLVSKEPK